MEFIDSDEDSFEEEIENLPILMDNIDDENYNAVEIIGANINGIQRIQHIKVINYIESIVRNYIETDFTMHFRLSREVAYDLIGRFEISQIYMDLQVFAGYEPMTAEKHMLCFLWFVGHQTASYRDVADRFGISISALHKLITRVTCFLVSLSARIIRLPTVQEREVTKQFYLGTKGFPGVVGAIDGTHIRIDRPSEDKDSYINRKQYFSIHMQGVVDHNKKIIDICVGYPGSVHDARVFRESIISTKLEDFCGDDGYILGDTAYPCLKHLLVPYKDRGHMTRAQVKFNQKLSSCRVVVENAFGSLKQRFRQLYYMKLKNIVRLIEIIVACCVLHNLANANDLQLFEPPINDEDPDDEVQIVPNANVDENVANDSDDGKLLRDELCRQFAMRN
ncbi:putative nuclease HARBI1 [Leptopilina heterotoma]|uniref:putative nuclease HARBI1 n=1 Tax=Leptopilina heterotoma TaxID=63436 RepID=UPI001CA884D0|nr:putative nuclease HARBI1 [Leptopilina heterotoma]